MCVQGDGPLRGPSEGFLFECAKKKSLRLQREKRFGADLYGAQRSRWNRVGISPGLSYLNLIRSATETADWRLRAAAASEDFPRSAGEANARTLWLPRTEVKGLRPKR